MTQALESPEFGQLHANRLSPLETPKIQYGGALFSAPDNAEWPNHEEPAFVGQ